MAPNRPIPALGPGSLIFTIAGTPPAGNAAALDISCQVTACKITFDSDKEDDLPTLCGGVLAGEKNYTSKLEASAAQDLEKNGLIDWTWKNAGKQARFEFIPLTGPGAATVTGTVTIDPVELGGDVKKRNVSDFEFDTIGVPVFTPDTTADTTEYPPLTP
ncbi:hypothetical protein [Gordonia sp. CPCC 205333]|uniref:hypothetical protein n=1 Tax=Gordonia sp. CPCC 205333 TaxID=3140790 RepID=UPI003AF369CF